MSLQECASRRQDCQRSLEAKLSSGLERCLGLVIARIQVILVNEQRKTDYKGDAFTENPANPLNGLPSASNVGFKLNPLVTISYRPAKQSASLSDRLLTTQDKIWTAKT